MELTLQDTLSNLEDNLARADAGRSLQEEADMLAGDLREYIRRAWPILEPDRWVDGQRRSTFRTNWHIDAICDHLEAARSGEIRRLLINIPPRHMKSLTVSVFWPTWRWTFEPELRFLTFSYADDLAQRDATKSRDILLRQWYRERWPNVILKGDVNRKSRYENTLSGHRIASHVRGGTGEGGDVIIIDDPHEAERVLSDVERAKVLRWHSNTVASRFNDPTTGVQVMVMQRLHEDDLAGHVLEQEGWTHLCLPARYVRKHPFLWPEDPRTEEGELLWPEHVPEAELRRLQSGMTAVDIAGQFQQLPAPLEGGILKVADWRFYDRELSYYAERSRFDRDVARALASAVGRFDHVIHSWDTSLKDRKTSDFVAGQVWGLVGANRYLLRMFKERLGFNGTVEAMIELAGWANENWPDTPHYIVVESQSNGKDAILEIKKRLTGVVAYPAERDKVTRARQASPALEGHNCYLPGYMLDDGTGPDPRTPSAVQEFVATCAAFPNVTHDDEVDTWSQAMNYARTKGSGTGSTEVPQGRTDRIPGLR